MTATAKPPHYRIYLLTVWHTPEQGEVEEASWRFHLTDPHTGKRYGFASPAALLATLQQAMRESPPLQEAP
jgi:hypothetical protein